MRTKTTIDWNKETGEATVTITDLHYNKNFIGKALCCSEDKDMCSRLTGLEIANRRAFILYLKEQKKKCMLEYEALKRFQNSVKNCKYYNEEFQIERKLLKELSRYENTILFLKEKISVENKKLKEYIEAKEDLYKKVREGRNNKK